MNGIFEQIGLSADIVLIALSAIVLILIVLVSVLWHKFSVCKKNYDKFMTGADGESLESAIIARFNEIDELDKISKDNTKTITELVDNLKFAYQKFSIVKYDAFKEMGGKLSFSLCMLTENNDGFILSVVHSNNSGCYTYIKEIIKGEPYVILSDDEKKVLTQAKTRKSCLDD